LLRGNKCHDKGVLRPQPDSEEDDGEGWREQKTRKAQAEKDRKATQDDGWKGKAGKSGLAKSSAKTTKDNLNIKANIAKKVDKDSRATPVNMSLI